MNLSIRPMTPTERNYSYTQGQEVMAKASCIGHLRADFGSDGEGFYSSWDDHTPALKTDDFKAELNSSKSTTLYGLRRTASVSWPPSS